jgi:hypothetical protein
MNENVFIIDADVLIHAFRYDFPPNGNHDGFWEWLNDLASTYDIVIPESVLKELREGNDGLFEMINQLGNLKFPPTQDSLIQLPNVLQAYGQLTELDLEIIGNKADPFLVAHGLVLDGTVVTNEIPEPGRTAPRNKKIPDICSILHVNWTRYPHFLWEMRGR